MRACATRRPVTRPFGPSSPAPRRRLPEAKAASADVAVPPAASAATSTAPSSNGTAPFAWERNWWPVHVLSYLDPTRPTPVELLGTQLVLWRDAAGTWRCFRDSCPHRRVPLSEGRVEGGELVCSYHGWRFNEGGACTAIPQAPDAKSLAAATASPRSCVTSFPTQEAGGLLWVWPEDTPSAAANAAAAVIPLPQAFSQPQFEGRLGLTWHMQELPYDYDILVENVNDPSHVPFAHHALVPFLDRKKARPLVFTPLDDLQPDDSDLLANGTPPATAFHFPQGPQGSDSRALFSPPLLITQHTPSRSAILVILAVPTGPGRSKVFVVSSTAGGAIAGVALGKLFKTLGISIPKWLNHILSMKLFDGDTVFLNAQGNFLRAAESAQSTSGEASPAWAKEYFMPMTCDRGVVGFRKWIDSVGGGGPVYPPHAAPAAGKLTREKMLDRMSQHTKHCPDCRSGLELADRLVTASKAMAAAAFFALCCLAGSYGFPSLFAGGLPSAGAVVAVLAAVAAARLHSAAQWLQKQFTFTDYVHADIP